MIDYTFANFWADVIKLLVPATIATIALIVSMRQYLFTKDKVKMELYDKRYQIYLAARRFMAWDRENFIGHIEKFYMDTAGAVFLFDDDILFYLDSLAEAFKTHYMPVMTANGGLRIFPNPQSQEEKDQLAWFKRQGTEIDEEFRSYLSIKHLAPPTFSVLAVNPPAAVRSDRVR